MYLLCFFDSFKRVGLFEQPSLIIHIYFIFHSHPTETAWILVREKPPKMMAWVSQAIHKAVGAADLDIKDFTLVSQENCESTSLSDDNGVEAMETFVFPYEGSEENLKSDDADNS